MTKAAIGFILLFVYIWFSEYLVRSQEDIRGTDVHDEEVRLKNDLMKNYTIDVLPPHTSSSPVVVKLGMLIISIKHLDIITQTLTTETWLKIGWKDSRLKWKPDDYAGITVLHFAPHRVWQPDIQLYNSAKLSEMEVKTELFALVYSDGNVLWVPPASLNSLCEVNLKYYPYDTHNCTYKFGSWTHNGLHIDVEDYHEGGNDSLNLSETWNNGGEWEILDSYIIKSTRIYPCCPEPYHDVTYSILLQRRSPFYKVAILCPLIATAFLILASFWVSPASYFRMTVNVLSFLIVIALLMHLSSKLPAVGNNCPVVMTLCGVLLMMTVLITVISIIFIITARSRSNEQTPEWIRKIVQSHIMKLFCVHVDPSMQGTVQTDDSINLVAEDYAKTSRTPAVFKPNLWLMFFTLIDKMLFLICLIIITSVIIAASA